MIDEIKGCYGCNSDVDYSAGDPRFTCSNCGLVLLNEKYATVDDYIKAVDRSDDYIREEGIDDSKYYVPICRGNYDESDEICLKVCHDIDSCKIVSPLPEDFYLIRNALPEWEEFKHSEQKWECRNGHTDGGNFCSVCGEGMGVNESKEKNLISSILNSHFFKGMKSYLFTIYFLVFKPNRFFNEAFGDRPKYYHRLRSTLDSEAFFLYTATLIVAINAYFMVILNGPAKAKFAMSFGGYSVDASPFVFNSIGVIQIIISLMVYTGLLWFFINFKQYSLILKHRIVHLSERRKISFKSIFLAAAYATFLELPFVVTMILGRMYENIELFSISTVLLFIIKLYSIFILLPKALKYSCKIKEEYAIYANILTNVWFWALYTFFFPN
ncbi:MAG: YIP1 family protein [Colwellia sp.]|nr:YIP1 family protein [Colwellia sp.]